MGSSWASKSARSSESSSSSEPFPSSEQYSSSEPPSPSSESSSSSESAPNQENEAGYLGYPQNSMEYDLEARNLRNPYATILNEILKEKAKLSADLVKENNKILGTFFDTFTDEMKDCDKIFELLYQKPYYTGSFYTDLRVCSPDEFDLNLVLRFPFKVAPNIQYNPQVPSYAKYEVFDANDKKIIVEKGLSRFFEDGFLIPYKILIWLQSVVDKALINYEPPSEVVRIKRSAGGPARTIILVKSDGCIDIDLVPVIECLLDVKPPGIHGMVYAEVKDDLQFFLVPKPYQPLKQAPVSKWECSRLWRVHYPKAESNFIYDFGCIKPVIKLLKLLRDEEEWSMLASYYLKTIALWMKMRDPYKENWRMDHIGEKFLEALEELKSCVEEREIPYFFSSKCNLLEKLSAAEAYIIKNRLKIIISKINRDPWNLWDIFDCPCPASW